MSRCAFHILSGYSGPPEGTCCTLGFQVILGVYWDNGKEHGDYYLGSRGLGFKIGSSELDHGGSRTLSFKAWILGLPSTLNPKTLKPRTLKPSTLNPKTLNPRTLKP